MMSGLRGDDVGMRSGMPEGGIKKAVLLGQLLT
jgi:hypothetical protein